MTVDRESIRADRLDLAYVTAEIVDVDGILVLFADNLVTFNIEGDGRLRAVGNGDPISHTPFTGNEMEAYQGKVLAVVQSGGREGSVTLSARGPGLKDSSVTIAIE